MSLDKFGRSYGSASKLSTEVIVKKYNAKVYAELEIMKMDFKNYVEKQDVELKQVKSNIEREFQVNSQQLVAAFKQMHNHQTTTKQELLTAFNKLQSTMNKWKDEFQKTTREIQLKHELDIADATAKLKKIHEYQKNLGITIEKIINV